jgi:hypothetical protein
MITNWTAHRYRRLEYLRRFVNVRAFPGSIDTPPTFRVDFPVDVQNPEGKRDFIVSLSSDEAHQFAADMVAELVQAADIENPMVTVIVYVRVNPTGEIEAEAFQTGSLAEANFLREKDREWSWRRIYREVKVEYFPTKREERS